MPVTSPLWGSVSTTGLSAPAATGKSGTLSAGAAAFNSPAGLASSVVQRAQPTPSSAFISTPTTGAARAASPSGATTAASHPAFGSMDLTGYSSNFTGTPGYSPPLSPTVDPGNNMVNPGYTEQAFGHVQERLLDDPAQDLLLNQYGQTQTPGAGESYLTGNLGSLQGPGQGEQYWNQVQGQYMNPFAGEQFARQATQNFSAQGPSSAFYGQSMGQYDDFTGYTGPQNTQGQYGQSSSALAGGSAGERGLAGIAGGYDSTGRYTDPNLSAGQYGATQSAFDDLPIANFDPFYDRARQLATQDYNRQAAGRGVYGSSEALSGVGNVITDIEAQRANRSFDAEMARAQEQRMRQQLLGEQARMGDLSSLGAFQANLSGAETFAGMNRDLGALELERNQVLGNLANMADSQALGAQQSNIAGLSAFGDIASNADRAETDRYTATTSAMNQADRTALDRQNSGADVAFRADDARRADYTAEANAAQAAGNLGLDRTRLGGDIADTVSDNDLQRVESFIGGADVAENDRQARMRQTIDDQFRYSKEIKDTVMGAMNALESGQFATADDAFNTMVLPQMQAANLSQQEMENARVRFNDAWNAAQAASSLDTGGEDEAAGLSGSDVQNQQNQIASSTRRPGG